MVAVGYLAKCKTRSRSPRLPLQCSAGVNGPRRESEASAGPSRAMQQSLPQ